MRALLVDRLAVDMLSICPRKGDLLNASKYAMPFSPDKPATSRLSDVFVSTFEEERCWESLPRERQGPQRSCHGMKNHYLHHWSCQYRVCVNSASRRRVSIIWESKAAGTQNSSSRSHHTLDVKINNIQTTVPQNSKETKTLKKPNRYYNRQIWILQMFSHVVDDRDLRSWRYQP